MAMNPATTDDVADRWRPLTPSETQVARVLLDDAWLDLTTQVPSLDSRLDAATLAPALVVRVLASMVLRVLRNPDGKVQESIDDYAYRRADAVADGLLYAAADEVRLLGLTAGQRSNSVRLVAYGELT